MPHLLCPGDGKISFQEFRSLLSNPATGPLSPIRGLGPSSPLRRRLPPKETKFML